MADVVTVTAKVSYRCWQVPNFAVIDMPERPKQDGIHPLPSIPVEDLEPAVLDALAQKWLDHLYAKVGRDSPSIAGVR